MRFPISLHRLSGCAAAILALLRFSAAAAPGDLDLHFNPLGIGSPPGSLREMSPQAEGGLHSLALLPDGRIVGAGSWWGLVLVCWLPDGSRDPGFGNGGIVSIPNPIGAYLTGMTVQENGRIVVAQQFSQLPVSLLRFLPDGAPDPEFGIGGTSKPVAGEKGFIDALMPLSSGKLLVGGGYVLSDKPYPKLWRLLPDGSIDPSFGTGGGTSLSFTGGFESIAVEPDGTIVAAGLDTRIPEARVMVARFHADGTLDESFGDSGAVSLPHARSTMGVHLAVADDRKILVDSVTLGELRVVRLLPGGGSDPSFGTGGYVSLGYQALPVGILAQPGGNVLVGSSQEGGGYVGSFSLVRLLPDGRPDAHFGTTGSGTAQFMFLDGWTHAYCMAAQPDGRVLVGGSFARTNSPNQMALVRFHTRSLTESLSAEWPAGTSLEYGGTVSWSVVRGIPSIAESTITLRNTGPAPLTNLSARFSGADSDHFALLSTLPPVLNSGDTAALTVRFLPGQQVSSFVAALVIDSGSPDIENFVIILRGSTVAAVATLKLLDGAQPLTANDDLDFGTTIASKPLTRALTLENTGNIELQIQGITLDTPNDFSAGRPETDRLLPGESTTFPVTFTPSRQGERTAKLHIASTDTLNPPLQINLLGRGAEGLDEWRLTHFDTLLNEGPAADLSDPDHDSVPNLLEYATLTSPVAPDNPAGYLILSGGMLEYVFVRPASASSELRYELEWTPSLEAIWISSGADADVLNENAGKQLVRFSVPAGVSGRRFVRLRVSRR